MEELPDKKEERSDEIKKYFEEERYPHDPEDQDNLAVSIGEAVVNMILN